MERKALRLNMIQNINSLFQASFNHVHMWSQPSQDPMKRMFATRLASIACAVAETALIIFKMIEQWRTIGQRCLGIKTAATIPLYHELRQRREEIGRLALGLLGTLSLGIVFSPTANFKLHVWLQLVVDHVAEQAQKERQAKLQAEEKKKEIEQARTVRFVKLEAEPGRREVHDVEEHLKSLLS